jgi:multisubunit Na+/H+ antiporter MnhB subunit
MLDFFSSTGVMIALGVALFLLCFVVPPLLAARKGYKWYLWVFGGGLLGLIILAFLPFANKLEQTPQERERLQGRGNMIGGVLTAISVGLSILRFLANMGKD